MYKISIIITTFNNEMYIIDSINSLLNQSYKNIEHIYNLQKNKNLNLKIIVLVNKCNFNKVNDKTLIYDDEERDTFNEIKKKLEKFTNIGIRCLIHNNFISIVYYYII